MPMACRYDAALRRALWNTLPLDHEDMFLGLDWKWWTSVALDMLQGKKTSVSAASARTVISGIRDHRGEDDLPTTIELSDVDEDTVVASHENRPFVHQMKWVQCN